MRRLRLTGEISCSRSHSWQLTGILSKVSKACLVVTLDTLWFLITHNLHDSVTPCSIKHSPVNPIALSPSSLPISLIFYNTNEFQVGKEMLHRKPFTPSGWWELLLSTTTSCTSLSFSLRVAGAERQRGGSLFLLPVNTGPSFNNSPLVTLPTTQFPVSITKALSTEAQAKPWTLPAMTPN